VTELVDKFDTTAALVLIILQFVNLAVAVGLFIAWRRAKAREEDLAYHMSLYVDPRMTTCWRCDDKEQCSLAFDPWNTDGDCLMDK